MAQTIQIPDEVYLDAEAERAGRVLDTATLVRIMYERGVTPELYKAAYSSYYQIDEAIGVPVVEREQAIKEVYEQVHD